MTFERRQPADAQEPLEQMRDRHVVVPWAEPACQRQCHRRERGRNPVGDGRVAMAEVGGVAGEQFVAALARQDDRDVLRGVLRQQPGGQQARVAKGLIHAPGPVAERAFARSHVHPDLVMVGPERVRDTRCEWRLVVARMVDAHAEGGEARAVRPGREHRDETGVDAARQEDTERHLAGDPRCDRVRERFTSGGDQGLVARVVGQRGAWGGVYERVPWAPIAPDAFEAVLDDQHVRGRQLPDRGVSRVIARERAVHEEARERRGSGRPGHPRQREQRARFGCEGESASVRRHEQRLLAGAIARERQGAGRAVPQGDREHAVERFGEVVVALLEQVREQCCVGAGCEVVPARQKSVLELAVVVDLAVRDADDVAGLVREDASRLVRCDDREPRDPHGALAPVPDRLTRGPSMAQAMHHGTHEFESFGSGQVCGDESGDTTHERCFLRVNPPAGARR